MKKLFGILTICLLFASPVWADELGGNGDCATDFFDTSGVGWAHDAVNEEYDCDGTQVADSDLTEGSICITGELYKVVFTVKNYAAGNVTVVCGTQEGSDISSDITSTQYITANGTDFIVRADSAFIGSVDDITVTKIISNRGINQLGLQVK